MTSLPRFLMFVDNEFTPAVSGRWFPSFDPARGVPWAEVAAGGPEDVDRAVQSADRAFRSAAWARMTPGTATASGPCPMPAQTRTRPTHSYCRWSSSCWIRVPTRG
jgi:hypothetical protein